MNDTPGTTVQTVGLTGLPFVIILMVMLALAAVSIWCFKTKRPARALLFASGSMVALYVLWNVWPALVVAVLLLTAGVIVKQSKSTVHRLRRGVSAGLREMRQSSGDSSAPADPPTAAE